MVFVLALYHHRSSGPDGLVQVFQSKVFWDLDVLSPSIEKWAIRETILGRAQISEKSERKWIGQPFADWKPLNSWIDQIRVWKMQWFYKSSYSMEINLWISFRFWHGMSSIDSFSGMKKSPTKLTREKSWFLIMPMIIAQVVKTVELHLTDRTVVEKFLLSLIPVLMRNFSFIIWIRHWSHLSLSLKDEMDRSYFWSANNCRSSRSTLWSFSFPSKLSEFQLLRNSNCWFHPCFLHLVFLLSWQTFYTPLGYIQD